MFKRYLLFCNSLNLNVKLLVMLPRGYFIWGSVLCGVMQRQFLLPTFWAIKRNSISILLLLQPFLIMNHSLVLIYCLSNDNNFCNDMLEEAILHLEAPSCSDQACIHTCLPVSHILQEGLTASKNLKVQQSYEELEAAFEPGKEFCFDATVHLQ